MPSRPLIAIFLTAAFVLGGGAWIVPGLVGEWIDPPTRIEDATILIVGSSLSEHLHEHLGMRGRKLVVDNTSARSYQLGDAWAAALNRADTPAVLTLFELNLYFFNERRFLYVPLEQHIVLFDDRNAVPVFREASYGLQRLLVKQYGIEFLLAEVADDWFPPYRVGWTVQRPLRELLVSVLTEADDPADLPRLSRTPRVMDALGRNFGRKDASGGPDTVVIEDVMRWVERSPERAQSVVFYFPPLNRSYIEQVAGEDGWTRVRRAADELSLAMRERGLNYLDYTSMLEDRQELFGDYGHLGKPGRTLLGAELSERLGSHLDCLQGSDTGATLGADCTLQFRRGPD